MSYLIEATRFAQNPEKKRLNKFPDLCPICNTAISSLFICANENSKTDKVECAFRCPREDCQSLFIGYYERTYHSTNDYNLQYTAPNVYQVESFSEEIGKLSPQFVDIFNQAKAAETIGLSQIIGIGYRKALEFIIKDYLIFLDIGKAELYKSLALGKCIQDHINNQNLKECAKRAVWLGNDETHYSRIWDTKDISDLKVLVKLSVNWIENEILTKRYKGEMPEKNDKTKRKL